MSLRAIKNFLLTSALFSLYQFTIIFILVFASIRAYPFIYGPIPSEGESVLEAMDKWDNSHQTLFTLLLVFMVIGGFVGIIITAQSAIELPPTKVTRVDINGQKYEASITGGRLSITKGTGNSDLANLILRVLIGLVVVPINILFTFYKFFMCLFSKKYKEAYSNVNILDYWSDMIHFDSVSLGRILYSNSFIFVEIILGIIIICLSYQLSYLK